MIPPDVANSLRAQLPTPQNAAQPTPIHAVDSIPRINDFLSDLAPGQRVLAEIQALLPNGAYRAVVAQRNITLALPFSAKPGDSLELEVVETEGKLALAFVGDRSPASPSAPKQESVATSLSQTGKLIGDLLGGIDNQGKRAPPVPLNGSQPLVQTMPKLAADLAPVLKQALAQSGMFYEAHQARWVAGELPTARLLQEPQGRLSQTRAPAPGAEPTPLIQPKPTSQEPSLNLPTARAATTISPNTASTEVSQSLPTAGSQLTQSAVPVLDTGSRSAPEVRQPTSTPQQSDTKNQGYSPPTSAPQFESPLAGFRGTLEQRALTAYHQQASLTRELPSIRQNAVATELPQVANTPPGSPESIAKGSETSQQVPAARTGGTAEMPAPSLGNRAAEAYSLPAGALQEQVASPHPGQPPPLPAASTTERASPSPEQISPQAASETSSGEPIPEVPTQPPSEQSESLRPGQRAAAANIPVSPSGTTGPMATARTEAPQAPTPSLPAPNASVPIPDSVPSLQAAVPEPPEALPPNAAAHSEPPGTENRPSSTGNAPVPNAAPQQGLATEHPEPPPAQATQSGLSSPPASPHVSQSPLPPAQMTGAAPVPVTQRQEGLQEPLRAPPEDSQARSQSHSVAPAATGDGRQGSAPVNQSDQAYRQLEQSATGRPPQNVSPGLPPELAPLVQQQLDALATQTFAWQGQIWPGQQMYWEIDEQQGRQGKSRDETGGQWETRLKLELPLLGDIEASLHLRPGNEIGISLSVKNDSSGARLESASLLLKQQFEAAGLNLTQFSVKNDTPTQ